jgi:hypothetical protein
MVVHPSELYGDLAAPERSSPSKVTREKPCPSLNVKVANILNSLEVFLVQQSVNNSGWIPLVSNVGRILNCVKKLHTLSALGSEDRLTAREVLDSVQERIDMLCKEGELVEMKLEGDRQEEASDLDHFLVANSDFIEWLADCMQNRVRGVEGTSASSGLEAVADCWLDGTAKHLETMNLFSLLDLDSSIRSVASLSTTDLSHESSTSSLCGDHELTLPVSDEVREECEQWEPQRGSETTPAWELEFLLRSDVDT